MGFETPGSNEVEEISEPQLQGLVKELDKAIQRIHDELEKSTRYYPGSPGGFRLIKGGERGIPVSLADELLLFAKTILSDEKDYIAKSWRDLDQRAIRELVEGKVLTSSLPDFVAFPNPNDWFRPDGIRDNARSLQTSDKYKARIIELSVEYMPDDLRGELEGLLQESFQMGMAELAKKLIDQKTKRDNIARLGGYLKQLASVANTVNSVWDRESDLLQNMLSTNAQKWINVDYLLDRGH